MHRKLTGTTFPAVNHFAGFTLTEVVIASALLIIAIVPIFAGIISTYLAFTLQDLTPALINFVDAIPAILQKKFAEDFKFTVDSYEINYALSVTRSRSDKLANTGGFQKKVLAEIYKTLSQIPPIGNATFSNPGTLINSMTPKPCP